MKILKLLNKKYFTIIFILLLSLNSYADDKPVDIWNIDKADNEENNDSANSNITKDEEIKKKQTDIYGMQSQKTTNLIELDNELNSRQINITGLYDPEDYGLDINMWSNSDGDQLKNIFNKLEKIKLSKDAKELLNISLLTNAHYPKNNISEKEFLKIRSDWLMRNSNLELIEEYLTKNQIINLHPKLSRYLVDQYLVDGNLEKACDFFSKNLQPINNEYLIKFNIYCLINSNKIEEAQLILDLKKELGFQDKYYETKLNYLLGYTSKIDKNISEKSILDFHLAHKTNPDFRFEPKESTNKMIWKYMTSSNLLGAFKEIDISEINKISTLEKATNDKNYPEKDLFELYKRFQFNINQLLNVNDSIKSLSNIESRALVYQKILLESEIIEKLKLLKVLKTLFEKDSLGDAFDIELKKFLEEVNPTEIPDNLTSFYYTNIQIKKNDDKKIKFNKDILHQSKLVNYFNGDYAKSKIEKDTENFLKKIKKNKKYFFSKKDQIF